MNLNGSAMTTFAGVGAVLAPPATTPDFEIASAFHHPAVGASTAPTKNPS